MKGWVLGLLLLVLGAPAVAEELVRATAIPDEEVPPSHPGRIEFRGGLILSSPNALFGGWSGLDLAQDGEGLVAVSDTGGWLRLRPVVDAAGRLRGVGGRRLFPMLGMDGQPISGQAADAEALRRAADGGWLVAFERQHRLWHYPDLDDLGRSVPTPVPFPVEGALMGANEGLEAIVTLAGGRLLLIEEGPESEGTPVRAWLGRDGTYATLAYQPAPEFRPTDGAALPSGDLLVVERAFSPLKGVRIRLVRVAAGALQAGAVLAGEELIRIAPPLAIDNIEALAVRPGAAGETLVYLLSDDNFSPVQRTLLFLFAVPD